MSWRLLSIGLLTLLLLSATGQAAPIPAPPKIAATSYLLLDINSDRILAEENADQRVEPASLTKIMTAYTVFREIQAGHIALSEEVLVSKKAWRTPGSRMFIEVGHKVKIEDLLKGLIIQSGNDAGVALAEHIAGSEAAFAELMNAHAAELGMHDTHFTNSTGLPDPEHYTTARDIARVAKATIKEFPEYYEWYAIKEFTYGGITQKNRNILLWQEGSVDGIKTGHTRSAGYCLVASAKRDEMRLVSVVTGTQSENARAEASQRLLRHGFRFYESHKLYDAGQEVKQVRIWKGDRDQLPLGPLEDTYITVPRGRFDAMTEKMLIGNPVLAPVRKGATVGHVRLSLDGEDIARIPLVALVEVKNGGIVDRLIDTALMWFDLWSP
ncbi:MAG TPA: D-alanyl-D-alanine carboxypeptidase [Chromatiales bacterium]|nr:D-alanyl-D-alanine carboxypeptidase [Chromatiales bacterium]